MVYTVAAGNSDKDAATFGPAKHPDVITVSALADFDGIAGGSGQPTCRNDQDDTLAGFSNWGSYVEVAAPGVCIESTWPGGGYYTISGTSMASPHVAGAAALLASSQKPLSKKDVYAIRQKIIDYGNYGWTDDSGDGVKEPVLDVSHTVFAPTTVDGSSNAGGDTNNSPSADFGFTTSGLAVNFTDRSTDSDGAVVAWNWDFGDGTSSSDRNPSYTYAVGGTYNVTLTVTDDVGATDEVSKGISVSEAGIRLSATGYKVKGVQHADLNWSDADSTNIDIYRNGALITTTANDGAYTDNIGQKGGGTYTYQACEAGTSTCSNEATVVL